MELCAAAAPTRKLRGQTDATTTAFLQHLADGKSESDALDELMLLRYCCRRMLLGHVDLIVRLLAFNRFRQVDDEDDDAQ